MCLKIQYFYCSDWLNCSNLKTNYQPYFTDRQWNLEIFDETDFLAMIIRKPNICTILQKLVFKIDSDYLGIIWYLDY